MPKFILVPSTDAASNAPVLTTALAVARVVDGHLAVLHVRPDVHEQIAAMAPDEVRAVSGLGERLEKAELETDRREREAEQAWHAFCADRHLTIADHPDASSPSGAAAGVITSEWLSAVGADSAGLLRHGTAADLIVIGRARPDGGIALDRLELALMATGRPVLIAPEYGRDVVGSVIAIAWKDTREAARAVNNAVSFIERARRVVIFTVEEADAGVGSAERLARTLRWRNPNVDVQRLPRTRQPPAGTLLHAAAEIDADLLVMGGYGHTRLREAMFGGFTRYVLEKAELPVLISH